MILGDGTGNTGTHDPAGPRRCPRSSAGTRALEQSPVELATLRAAATPDAIPRARSPARELEDLWDRHGGSVYALACALLG